MSSIVTGATGHLSSLVVEGLLRRGTPASEVVATGRSTDRPADLEHRGVEVRRADFSDLSTLVSAFAGGTTPLSVSTDAVREAGVATLVHTSAPAADTAAVRLAEEHRRTEDHLRASSTEGVVLRNGWWWESCTDQLLAVREHATLVGSAAKGRVNPAARTDHAEAAAIVMTTPGHGGKVYEFGSDTANTLTELAAAMSDGPARRHG